MKYLILLFLSLGVSSEDLNTENNGETIKQSEDLHSNDISPTLIKPKSFMKIVEPPIEQNAPILIDNNQDHGNVRMPNGYYGS